MNEIDVTVTKMLASILSRVNMILFCLPDRIQTNMLEVKNNVIDVLKSLGCNIELDDKNMLNFLDKVSLYDELSSISNDLGICVLLTSNNILLEDAFYNINFAIKNMAQEDSVFEVCYNNGIARVLKNI